MQKVEKRGRKEAEGQRGRNIQTGKDTKMPVQMPMSQGRSLNVDA